MSHFDEAEQLMLLVDGLAVEDLRRGPWVADAQVHATLALVEQQKLANLIALAGLVDKATTLHFDSWDELVEYIREQVAL